MFKIRSFVQEYAFSERTAVQTRGCSPLRHFIAWFVFDVEFIECSRKDSYSENMYCPQTLSFRIDQMQNQRLISLHALQNCLLSSNQFMKVTIPLMTRFRERNVTENITMLSDLISDIPIPNKEGKIKKASKSITNHLVGISSQILSFAILIACKISPYTLSLNTRAVVVSELDYACIGLEL